MTIDNLLFIDDRQAVGKWETCAIVSNEEDFDESKITAYDGRGFQEIYFLPEGQKYWIFEGWTKGILFTHYGGDEPVVGHTYRIKAVHHTLYMFLHVNEDQPYINVLKKVSSKAYQKAEIGRHDVIDLPFAADKSVVGTWKTVDFISQRSDFIKDKPQTEKLWLKSVCFSDDGTATRDYDGEIWKDCWTKGYLLDKKKSVRSAYTIECIEGKEYLFLEWKTGNYVYGGEPPKLYVLVRQ